MNNIDDAFNRLSGAIQIASESEFGDSDRGLRIVTIRLDDAEIIAKLHGAKDAYDGAREDLAIWKRRALEAERDFKNLCDRLNEESGPTFMGEAVLDRKEIMANAEFLAAASKLIERVDGPCADRWTNGYGLRIKDTPEYVGMYVLLSEFRRTGKWP